MSTHKHFSKLLTLLILVGLSTVSTPAQHETLPELIRRVKPSVVSIIAYDAQNEPVTTGSGFFIRPNQIVTNLHVV
ncbi:MAG: hypothetical protein M3458_24555, partial [Acidobacteriota bacterium]|nr:hypothetical protein [Acidobacteriota bacterium]